MWSTRAKQVLRLGAAGRALVPAASAVRKSARGRSSADTRSMSVAVFRRTSSRSTKPRTSRDAPEFASSLAFLPGSSPCGERPQGWACGETEQWRDNGPLRARGPVRSPRTAAPLAATPPGDQRYFFLATSPPRHLATSPPRHLATSPPRHLAPPPPRHPAPSPPRHLAPSPPRPHQAPAAT